MERKALKEGSVLQEGEIIWVLHKVVGCGGSALIYDASRMLPNGQKEHVILKEIYPVSENGCYVRLDSGRICAGSIEEQERRQEEVLLERLRAQMEKEEITGRELRDTSFLVCNLRILRHVHLQGKSEELPGFAEMISLGKSGLLLRDYEIALNRRWNGAIPIEKSLRIIMEIAGTMKKIHESGFLYADFSPSNVFLLKETLTAVFIDFGSALKKYGKEVETRQYIPSSWGYRAPELAGKGMESEDYRRLSESGDVYALLSFFYELISGERFAKPGGDEFEKALYSDRRMISWERAKQIGVRNPVALFYLNWLFLNGLCWSRENRIPDIEELQEQIRLLEEALVAGEELSQPLTLLWRQNRKDVYGRFVWMLEDAIPTQYALCRAIRQLDQDMQNSYEIGETAFRFCWLNVWYEKAAQEMKNLDEAELEEARLLLDYCGVAVYNYRGEADRAIEHYKACEARKEEIGLEKYLAVRLRAAESYANVFAYEKAYVLVKKNLELLYKRRETDRKLSKQLGFRNEEEPGNSYIGRTESAAGRYLSFLKKPEAAMHFERALQEFRGDNHNTMRVRNYQFQMAIELRDRELFEQCRKYCLGEGSIAEQLEYLVQHPEGQNSYHLYVLLKGIEVFLPLEDSVELFTEIGAESEYMARLIELLSVIEDREQRRFHPWELIYRHAAIVLARIRGCMTEYVQKLFSLAVQVFPSLEQAGELCLDDGRALNTILTLHMVTQVCEAELSFRFAKESELVRASGRLETSLEQLHKYLRKKKCRLFSEKEWGTAHTLQEVYLLVRKKFSYEYY